MLLLRPELLIISVTVPTILTLLTQIILCRFAKKATTCMIPFFMILGLCGSILVFILSGMLSDIYEGILILFILEAISACFIADIVGWIFGLAWRGYHIVKTIHLDDL